MAVIRLFFVILCGIEELTVKNKEQKTNEGTI